MNGLCEMREGPQYGLHRQILEVTYWQVVTALVRATITSIVAACFAIVLSHGSKEAPQPSITASLPYNRFSINYEEMMST